MIRRRKRHEVPGLNTTSTADISFMLLIFFLVTTSMDADKGMNRQMPPVEPDKQEQMDVDRTKVLSLQLNADGSLLIEGKPADVDKIVNGPLSSGTKWKSLKEFIIKAGPQHIIELRTDPSCDYDAYFKLQNEIVRSYREIKDAAAMHRYGKKYHSCTLDERDALNESFPQRVQERY